MVSFTGRAATPTHVLVRFLDRESVRPHLETEQYFGLDETGTRMWQLVTGSPNIDAACQRLLVEFDLEPELSEFEKKRKSLKHTLRWSAMGPR